MNRLEIFNEADRLAVASILVKNGYTVRQSRERIEGKRSYIQLLEYQKNEKKDGEPANKKSSPKEDLTEENFVGSRRVKRVAQKSHHKVLA